MATDPNQIGTATATPSLTGELLPTPSTQNALIVPEIGSQEIVSLNEQIGRKTPKISEERARELASKINLKDSSSIITFGIEAEKNATQVSEQMLQGVRTKDTGPVGDQLNAMVREMKGLDFGALAVGKKPGLLTKLLGGAGVLQKFLDKYKTVEGQIIAASNVLESHRVQMLKDIVAMDKLYDATLTLLDHLDEQIAAVDWLIKDVNENRLPPILAKANETGDMADAQEVQDMTAARDELERRRYNLLLTRDDTIRALPSIRIVQDLDKGLAGKIQSQLINNVSMWKRTMAVQIAVWRAAEAGKATESATNFTNELIRTSADQLNETNRRVRKNVERGIYDVEAAEHAHMKLLQTINESIDLVAEGKQKRAEGEQRLEAAQENLRKGLLEAAQRQKQLNARRDGESSGNRGLFHDWLTRSHLSCR